MRLLPWFLGRLRIRLRVFALVRWERTPVLRPGPLDLVSSTGTRARVTLALRRQIKCSVADLVLWHGSRLSHDVTSDRNHLTPNLSQIVARTASRPPKQPPQPAYLNSGSFLSASCVAPGNLILRPVSSIARLWNGTATIRPPRWRKPPT